MAADNRNNSHVSNYELMETIRKYETIYNSSSEYHKNGKMLKKDAWAAVADELNIDIAEAQNRYGNIRTVFSRYLKTIRRQQAGGGGPGTFRLGEDVPIKDGFEYLRWLISHIKPRNCIETQESEEGDDSTATWSGGMMLEDGFEDSVSGQVEENSTIQIISHTPSQSRLAPRPTKRGFHTTTPSSLKKYVKSKARHPALAVSTLRRTTDESAGNSNTNDEDMMFCMGLVPKMRRLPERYKTAAQLRILQVICDLECSDSVPVTQLPAQTAVIFPSQGGTWQPQGVTLTQAGQSSDVQPTSLHQ